MTSTRVCQKKNTHECSPKADEKHHSMKVEFVRLLNNDLNTIHVLFNLLQDFKGIDIAFKRKSIFKSSMFYTVTFVHCVYEHYSR